MRNQWDNWKTREDLTIARFIEMRNGPKLSRDDINKFLNDARQYVKENADNFEFSGDINGSAQPVVQDTEYQDMNLKDESKFDENTKKLSEEVALYPVEEI